jgi:hypothetical protein
MFLGIVSSCWAIYFISIAMSLRGFKSIAIIAEGNDLQVQPTKG